MSANQAPSPGSREIELSREAQKIARVVDTALKERFQQHVGFALFLLPMGEGAGLSYVSNCDRAGIREALKGLLASWDRDPHIPFHERN